MALISMKRLALACMRGTHVSTEQASATHTRGAPVHGALGVPGFTRRRLAVTLAIALAVGVPSVGLHAMNIHVNGNQVFLSGDVEYQDLYVLADVVDRLRRQGRQIDTLVMRNSNGGAVYAGYDIGDFARRNHLTTVVSGYCISACSMMFVGGSARAFAAGDQPLWNQYIGIHGMTGDKNTYADSSRLTPFYQYFLQAIAGGDPSKTDMQLLDDAFSNHGSAFARIYDPAANKNPSVFWCHSDCDKPEEYKAYPNDNAYNLGFITQQVAVATTDTLTISKNVSGNVNSHYYNGYDPEAKPYINEAMTKFSAGWNFLASHLAPKIRSILTPEAALDDIEVQLYNQLSPEDRRQLLIQFTQEYYLQYESQAKLTAHLANPDSEESWVFTVIDNGSAHPFVDPTVLGVDDVYGVIKVTDDATWTLGQSQRTAADALLLDHGRLHLDGGIVNITDNYIYNGGRLDGAGFVGEAYRGDESHPQYSTTYVRDGGIVHPTGGGLDFTGQLELGDKGVLALDVNPGLASDPAPLRFSLFSWSSMSWLNVASVNALIALNVAPGFYRPGQAYNLIGPSIDLPAEAAEANFLAKLSGNQPPKFPLLGGYGFRYMARADAQGNVLSGYTIDVSPKNPDQNLFHPFDNSLLSYKLIQTKYGAWLQANDPFTDPSLCGNRGCGLGTALSAAAQSADKGLQPLLGAIEFSTPEQASHAAKQLRGESYGSLRTASLSLLGAFDNTLSQHLRAVDPDGDQAAQLAIAGGAIGMGLNNPRHAADLSSMMSYLVANDDSAGGTKAASSDVAMWGRLFDTRGRLDSSDGVAGLRQRSVGVMLGIDRRLASGTVIGASAGYGKLRADGEDTNNADASGFHGRVRALDMRFYVDHRFERGYLDASLAYTRLRDSVTRSIQLPLFAARTHARYGGNAWSLHLEHGWTLQDRHGVVWQPILPSIDVTRLPGEQFADQGAGAAGLQVDAKRRFDPRLGVGLQVAKSFAWGNGTLMPHARVLLQHRFINNENTFMANLQGYPQGVFEVASEREARNHALLDVGLTARRGDRTALLLDYVGDFARRHRDQGVMLGVRHRW